MLMARKAFSRDCSSALCEGNIISWRDPNSTYLLPRFLDSSMIFSKSAGDKNPPFTKALIKSLFFFVSMLEAESLKQKAKSKNQFYNIALILFKVEIFKAQTKAFSLK